MWFWLTLLISSLTIIFYYSSCTFCKENFCSEEKTNTKNQRHQEVNFNSCYLVIFILLSNYMKDNLAFRFACLF